MLSVKTRTNFARHLDRLCDIPGLSENCAMRSPRIRLAATWARCVHR